MLLVVHPVIDAVAPLPGEHVLEVAGGTGLVARLAASLVAPVRNFDFGPAMISIAQKPVEGPPGVGMKWHCASALAMPFVDGAFDVVFCSNGLQVLPDPAAGLAEMRRGMKPGARLIGTVLGAVDRCEGYALVLRALERRGVDSN